jgi:hypothetical protein
LHREEINPFGLRIALETFMNIDFDGR